jgi:uncharacterized protein YdhG (YjbR/CyaY superfamily)
MTPRKLFKTTDKYIGNFPQNVQRILEELRQTIREAAPEAEETISYQMPAFKLNGILVWFAAFKKHIGLYPTASAVSAFKEKLGNYEKSKGTIKFPIDDPIPYYLVKEIVEFRVKETSTKNAHRTKK